MDGAQKAPELLSGSSIFSVKEQEWETEKKNSKVIGWSTEKMEKIKPARNNIVEIILRETR